MNFWLKKYGINNDFNYKKNNKEEIPYINLSDRKFIGIEDEMMKFGPKYILGDKIDLKDAIPKVEIALESIPDEHVTRIRNLAQNEIEKAMKKKSNVSTKHKAAIYQLKKFNDVTYMHTDKTGKLAIMNTCDYKKMMQETIEKVGAVKVNKDPNKTLLKKCENLIKDGSWPDNKKPFKTNFTPHTPNIFGRLKDHKTPFALRPIVNKRTGPTYDIEKYMKKIYQELLPNSECSITSNTEFLQRISDYKPNKDDVMISLDIVNLYPSIDLIEMNKIINDKISDIYNDQPTKNTLESATNLILNETYFRFDDEIFKQMKGVPMGSPVSGIVAEWKLRNLESKIFEDSNKIFIKWIRYVDDVFAIVNSKVNLVSLLNKLNTYDPGIQFTLEVEKDKTLPFLDVNVIRGKNNLQTTVYRKPTANINIPHISSKTPFNYKVSSLKAYIFRALKICSDKVLLNKEMSFIKNIAIKAGYNRRMINRLIEKSIKNFDNIKSGQSNMKYAKAIPYMEGVSLKLKKEFKKFNVILPIAPDKSIYKMLRSENKPVDPQDTAGIYKISFEKEGGVVGLYIGMTKRRISERMKEHQRDLKFSRESTAMARLNVKTPIRILKEKTKKLANYVSGKYAPIRETIEIITEEGEICNDMIGCVDKRWRNMLGLKSRGIQ